MRISKIKEIAELGEILSPPAISNNSSNLAKETAFDLPKDVRQKRSLSELNKNYEKNINNSSSKTKQEGIMMKTASNYFVEINTAPQLMRDIVKSSHIALETDNDNLENSVIQMVSKPIRLICLYRKFMLHYRF